MEIVINNQPKSFDTNGITVQEVLNHEMPGGQKGIAVAINNVVVPKTEWNTTVIHPNDTLLIIKATQGG
ncbi:MAG: sulfur carrier protein ThiS [Bacteroidetes bacterium]|nr:sulfur carrier protein ThiS [Bacteroidota bacterium]